MIEKQLGRIPAQWRRNDPVPNFHVSLSQYEGEADYFWRVQKKREIRHTFPTEQLVFPKPQESSPGDD